MKIRKPISLYWKCQLIGWSLASLYWFATGYFGTQFSWTLAIILFVGDLLIYIPLSHLYRNISLKFGWQKMGIQSLLVRLIPSVIFLGLGFMILTIGKNYLVRYWFAAGFDEPFDEHLRIFWFTTFITGLRLMSVWVLAYYGYHFAQREMNAVRETARLSIVAKDAAFNNLSAQLNPHFFFNSLNSIKALVIENPMGARRAIDLLSDLLRISLYHRDVELISIQDELALVEDYIELEKVRFENRLVAQIEVDKSLSGRLVLPLSVQVLVENAIKHGIAKRKDGGTVHIKIEQENDMLITSVQNPGKLEGSITNGLGIRNLTERLQIQFNGKGIFKISQQSDETVLATITSPLI